MCVYFLQDDFCHILTLSDAGQNRTSVDVKFTPLEWNLALYSWQRRVFPAELHQLCVNNQGLTCGVKPCNWSDTSKRRLAPSLGGKTLHGASKADRGGRFTHTHIHKHTQTHTGQEKEVMRLDDTVGVPILSYKCFLCLSFFAISGKWMTKMFIVVQRQWMNTWNEHVLSSLFLLTDECNSGCVQLQWTENIWKMGKVFNGLSGRVSKRTKNFWKDLYLSCPVSKKKKKMFVWCYFANVHCHLHFSFIQFPSFPILAASKSHRIKKITL